MEKQTGWPTAGVEAARKARAAAVRKKEASYTFSYPAGKDKKLKEKTMYINYSMCPPIVARQVAEFDGAKQEQRPHRQARAGGQRTIREAHVADRHTAFDTPAAAAVQMPDECRSEDVGWKPGPVPGCRPLPKFTGPEPGCAFPGLTCASSAVDIMAHLLTDTICGLIVNGMQGHAHIWNALGILSRR